MDAVKSPKRLLYAGVIRAFALFLVIFGHVFSSYCENIDAYGRATWWMTNLMNTFIRPCGPLFFMVSGLLLLDPTKSEPLSAFFKKRGKKILAFAVWSLLYALWLAHWDGPPFTWKATIRKGLQEPIYDHLWFIYTLSGLYLATPILRTYVRSIQTADKIYFAALWFFSVCVPGLLLKFYGIDFGEWLSVATGFVGYFVLGHFLREVRLDDKYRRTARWLMLVLYAFGAIATYQLTARNAGNLDEFFYDDLSPNVIALTVLVFLWLKSLPYENFFERYPRLKPGLDLLTSCSFGIYLMHMMILEGLGYGIFGFVLTEHSVSPLIGIFSTTFAVLIIGTIITSALQKIPMVKIIVPG